MAARVTAPRRCPPHTTARTGRLLYNSKTGALYYTPNGTSASAIQFATIANKPILSAADFVLG